MFSVKVFSVSSVSWASSVLPVIAKSNKHCLLEVPLHASAAALSLEKTRNSGMKSGNEYELADLPGLYLNIESFPTAPAREIEKQNYLQICIYH